MANRGRIVHSSTCARANANSTESWNNHLSACVQSESRRSEMSPLAVEGPRRALTRAGERHTLVQLAATAHIAVWRRANIALRSASRPRGALSARCTRVMGLERGEWVTRLMTLCGPVVWLSPREKAHSGGGGSKQRSHWSEVSTHSLSRSACNHRVHLVRSGRDHAALIRRPCRSPKLLITPRGVSDHDYWSTKSLTTQTLFRRHAHSCSTSVAAGDNGIFVNFMLIPLHSLVKMNYGIINYWFQRCLQETYCA